MTLINVLENEFLDSIPLELIDITKFIVYIKQDEKFILNTNERCPVQPRRICDPRELEL